MKTSIVLALLALMGTSIWAQDPAPPAAQFQQLLKDYSTVAGAFRAAETDVQRIQAVERFSEYPQKFLELADKHATDPVALPALRQAVQAVNSVDSQFQMSWEMNHEAFPASTPSDAARRIVEVLLRDHLASDQLAPICDRMRFGFRHEFESFLSAAMESNPHRDVQGLACLALAQLLRNQLLVVDRVAERPDWVARYDAILGREYFLAIRGSARSKLEQRIEALYERATQFDDVINVPYTETVAAKAKTELFEIRHLSVGNVAPDIEGRDQFGQPLKLSDYRGKVVLLYFWLEY
jgi:hypothetical protein